MIRRIANPYFALGVLFSMNLLNYIDRYVFFAVGPLFSKELSFSDGQFGLLSTAFMVVYTLVSPIIGYLGDRYSRRILLSLGVGLWSVATVGTAFAGQLFGENFWEMFFWRAILGVGEASYGVVAPTLLADLFPLKHRGRVISAFYLALPVGGAIGYGLGGWVGSHFGWQAAFFLVGLPGLLVALMGLMIHEPDRGASEGHDPSDVPERPTLRDYLKLFLNHSFVYNTAGLAAVTFATGAYATWGLTFYHRVRGMSEKDAGLWIGAMTLLAGLFGIPLGAWVADRLLRYTRRAYLLWAGIAVLAATPFCLMAILVPERNTSLVCLFVGMLFLAAVLGPCNTVTANVVPANQRAAGFALSIFLLHLFGDISSPALIGVVSEWLGQPAVANSVPGQVLAMVGVGPVPSPTGPSNLTAGMLLVVPMMILGAVFFFLGTKSLVSDQQQAREISAGKHETGPEFGH